MSNKKKNTGPSKRNLIFSEELPEGAYGSPRGANEPIQSKDANVSYSMRKRSKAELDDTPDA